MSTVTKFAKGIGSQIKEPIVINQGETEVDRFTGVFKYPKESDRELIRIHFTSEGIKKAKALAVLSDKADKDQVDVTEEMIQAAWKPMNDGMNELLQKWFVKGETDDDRVWEDNTLPDLLELTEYRDGLFAALKRIATGQHLKEQAIKN